MKSEEQHARPHDPVDRLDPDAAPFNPLTEQPVTYGEESLNVLTPMGQVESYGRFARSLGPRRVKMVLVVLGICVLIPAVIATFS